MCLLGGGATFRAEMLAMMEQVDLLGDLAWREIEVLATYMQAYEAEPGSMVFQEGEPGDYMGLLVGGRVVIRKEAEGVKEAVISIEGQGRSIGEMALIDREPRSASCKVLESATLLILTRKEFERLGMQHPGIALKLLMRISRLISRRLRLTSGQLVEHLAC
jgi:CRP/FNR family transcriptional regulator, cyclic AMP receptor protein